MSQHDGQGCCCGCSSQELSGVSRRRFLAAGALAAALPVAGMLGAEADLKPRQQPIRRPLRVQPVFNCKIYQPRPPRVGASRGPSRTRRNCAPRKSRSAPT